MLVSIVGDGVDVGSGTGARTRAKDGGILSVLNVVDKMYEDLGWRKPSRRR